jgi:hypothetical protein
MTHYTNTTGFTHHSVTDCEPTRYPRDSRIGGLEDTIKISEEQTVFNPLVDQDQIDNIQYPLGTVNADLLNLVFWTGKSDGAVQKGGHAPPLSHGLHW